MPKSRWAWEFLRRNPDYEVDFERHMLGALTRDTSNKSVEILRLERAEPGAEKWGLLFFASPNHTARTAPAFWTQNANPNVISVDLVPRQSGDPAGLVNSIFDLRLHGIRRILLTDSAQNEHLLIRRGGRVVQMRCTGHTLLQGDVELRFILEGFGDLDAKVSTIKRLAKLYNHHSGSHAHGESWSTASAHLRDALIALDVYQAGEDHIDAAQAIHGETMVDTDFSKSDPALKNRMYRARKRGIELMQGGYLSLMKPQ